MTWKHSISMVVIILAASWGGCEYRNGAAAVRSSNEQWLLVGEYTSPRKSGPPKENWIGLLFTDGSLRRLVDVPMKTPDGDIVRNPSVTYNALRKVLICEHDDLDYNDVWRHDLATDERQWISKGRWNNTRGFAWSPDGNKVAFVASTRDNPAAFVVEYDLDADKWEVVATDAFGNRDDQQEGDSSIRPRRPVYSEDGNYIYYVSMDQHVMRVERSTKKCTQLPFTDAITVLTVKGQDIVYAREIAGYYRFQVVKGQLEASDDTQVKELYTGEGVIWGNYVSPSRRFILFASRMGYSGTTRLVDVVKNEALHGYGLWGPDGFRVQSTAFVRADVP